MSPCHLPPCARNVQCDRQRPCSTCIRRGTQHLCKTFNTSELDPETLQKKQARRSLAEINAIFEAPKDEHDDDPVPQQRTDQHQPPEHPMMAFINLMLKDLTVFDDSQASSHASPESVSPMAGSPAPARATVSRYLERACLTKILEFCAILPDWSQMQALLRHYLWNVDWKFLVTAQDLLEAQTKDLWVRVIVPAQRCDSRCDSTAAVSGISFQAGDLSRLALLASVLGETVESMAPETIAEVLPISRPGVAAAGPVSLEADANPRVKALLLLTYHVPALIEECVRLDEMTLELVQANVAAFSLWSNQGLHGTASNEFPRWTVTIRAAKGCNLFVDPSSNGSYSQVELDHRRRLAWLVYGYDHAFAVGANTKPLIVESQFSVDQPSSSPPWSAFGAPPDPCLAMLEVEGGKIAQLVSSTLCYGPPLHRKAMETDKKILDTLSQVHASYNWDHPDLSYDNSDPFRARRRCWLQLTTAWQRGSLHRQFFFPNGRITNGELATSRHIATDSALRSITAVRELRKLQNRFSDHMGSAWWYQYYTEPCMTLATAALLLIRSKGGGVPGLSNEANCWPTLMHFTRIIDECIMDLEASTHNTAVCLPSLLAFAKGCLQLILQLRHAVQTSFDAFIQSQPDLANLKSLEIDENIIPLLHPRSRQKSPGSQSQSQSQTQSHIHGSESSAMSSNHMAYKQGLKRSADAARRSSAVGRSRKSIGNSRDYDGYLGSNSSSPSKAEFAQSLSVSPRTSNAFVAQTSSIARSTEFAAAGFASSSIDTTALLAQAHSGASTSPLDASAENELSSGALSLSFGRDVGFGSTAASTMSQAGVNASMIVNSVTGRAVCSNESQQPIIVAAPHFGVPALVREGQLLSPAEPFALRDYYSDDGVQRANVGRGLADWLASAQVDMMMSQQPATQL